MKIYVCLLAFCIAKCSAGLLDSVSSGDDTQTIRVIHQQPEINSVYGESIGPNVRVIKVIHQHQPQLGPIQVAPHQQPIETVKTFKVIPDNGNPAGSGNFEDSHSAGGFSSDDYLKLINILRQQYAPDEPIHMPRSKNVHVPHFKPVPAGKVFPKYPPANYGDQKGGYSGGYIDFDEYDDNDSSDDEGYDSGYSHGNSGSSHGDYPRGGYSHHGSSHAGSSHGDHSHQGTSHRGYYYHGPSHYRHSHGHVHHHRHPKSDFDHWHHDFFHGFDHVKKFKFFATLGGASGSSFH